MGVVVVVSVLIAIALIVAVVVTARRLAAQRASTAAAEARSTEQAAELATVNAALDAASSEKAAALERAMAAEEATTLTAEQAELAEQQARQEADAAAEALRAAEDRAAAAERRAVELVELVEDRPVVAGLDADVVWSLEQARSERAWRLTMAPGPDAEPVFTGTGDPLLEALQVELDAAREEVGAIVELEAELSAELTAAASVLALRAAQELLAGVVRQAEETTLRLWIDGDDLVIAIRAVDEQGELVEWSALPFPPSLDIQTTDDGVRIRHAVADSDDS